MRTALFTGFFGLCLVMVSCSSREKLDLPARVVLPKLSSIQQEIFTVRCTAPSCHGSGIKGGLSLVDGNLFQQLIGIAGAADRKNLPPFSRVKRGSLDSSFLYVKITLPDSAQGELMPKGSDKLTQEDINAIRQWIMSGAPNN